MFLGAASITYHQGPAYRNVPEPLVVVIAVLFVLSPFIAIGTLFGRPIVGAVIGALVGIVLLKP